MKEIKVKQRVTFLNEVNERDSDKETKLVERTGTKLNA